MRQIDAIIAHHSASPSTTTMEQVDQWHRDRGWDGIGYHVYIQAGNHGPIVRLARPLHERGAHDGGENTGTIGVCLAGDCRAGRMPKPAMWYALLQVLADLCRQFALEPDDVFGHREHEPMTTQTRCPGFDPGLLRSELRNFMEQS